MQKYLQITRYSIYSYRIIRSRWYIFLFNKFNSRYNKNTENKINNYIIDFIERIIKVLGNKIKIGNDIIYMKDTLYIIDHDFLGNERKETITLLESDNKIEIIDTL